MLKQIVVVDRNGKLINDYWKNPILFDDETPLAKEVGVDESVSYIVGAEIDENEFECRDEKGNLLKDVVEREDYDQWESGIEKVDSGLYQTWHRVTYKGDDKEHWFISKYPVKVIDAEVKVMRKFVLLYRHQSVFDKDGNPIEMIIDENKSEASQLGVFYDLIETHGIPIRSIPCYGDLQVSIEDEEADAAANRAYEQEMKKWYLSKRGEMYKKLVTDMEPFIFKEGVDLKDVIKDLSLS